MIAPIMLIVRSNRISLEKTIGEANGSFIGMAANLDQLHRTLRGAKQITGQDAATRRGLLTKIAKTVECLDRLEAM